MNNLNLGLDHLVSGIMDSTSLVAFTARNNSLDGRKFQQ